MFENFSSTYPSNISATMGEAVNATDEVCTEQGSRAEKVLKVVAYFIILVVSLVGNSLVILVFCKNKPLRRSINYFVVNMAASDLFTPLTIMPVTIAEILSGSEAFPVDTPLLLGNILCKLCHFLPDVSMVVSIESLLLISVDRLVAVVFPLKSKVISSKVRLICILCTWIVAISVHAPYFQTVRLTPEGNSFNCQTSWDTETHENFVTAVFIIFFFVPVCVLAILYSTIAWTLKRRHSERKQMSTCDVSRASRSNTQIIRLSLAILTTFAVCIGPFVVYNIIGYVVRMPPLCAVRTVISFVLTFMMHSWGAINPCICFTFSKNYRRALQQIRSPYRSRPFIGSLPMSTSTNTSRRCARRSSCDNISLRVIGEYQDERQEEQEEQEQGQERGLEEQEQTLIHKEHDENNADE